LRVVRVYQAEVPAVHELHPNLQRGGQTVFDSNMLMRGTAATTALREVHRCVAGA
jgi:hypothetical protein